MAFALALQSVTDLPNNHGRVLLTATLFTIIFTVKPPPPCPFTHDQYIIFLAN